MSELIVPEGLVQSFLNCKIKNLKKIVDLYSSVLEDAPWFDGVTEKDIIEINDKLKKLIDSINEIKEVNKNL